MANPFETPPVPKTDGNKENKKMLFSDPELKVNVEAENADEAQRVFEKIRMQRDGDVRKAIDSTPKLENMKRESAENKYFANKMNKELEMGDPTKALNYCLSQGLNDKEQDYSAAIKKLRNWQLKFGKAESLANIDLAVSFLKELGDNKEGTWGWEITELIKKNKFNEALGTVGEVLVDIDKRITAAEAGDLNYTEGILKNDKFQKNILEKVRDTLFAQIGM